MYVFHSFNCRNLDLVRFLTTHEGGWYIMLVVRKVYVCLAYLRTLQVEFVYGHQVKVNVTGAKKVENPYPRNVKLRPAVALVL